MEKKAKFKKPLIIIISVVAVCAAGYFLFTQNSNKTNNELCDNCTIDGGDNNSTKLNKAKYFNLTFSGETKEYNAYDFIIEKMSQAQYWTNEEHKVDYHDSIFPENTQHIDAIPNGTGWTLIDENTATFARGFESRLAIKFSDNSAYNDPLYSSLDYLEDPYGEGVRWHNLGDNPQYPDWSLYDLKNEPYALRKYSDEFIELRTYYDFNNLTVRRKNIETSFDDPDGDFNLAIFYEIYETLQFYNKIFAELDILILNEPAGTLTSYKNKTIQVPVELIELTYLNRECDGKINSIFDERSGWQVHWEEDENVPWLEDYRDVLNQKFPETSEDSYIVGVDGRKWTYYSPIFLYCAHTDWYNEMGDDYYYKNDIDQADSSGAIMMYYVKPLYEKIFGFNGIYFVDDNKVNDGAQADASLTLEDFNSGHIDMSTFGNNALSIHNAGDVTFSNSNQIYNMTDYVEDLTKYYNIESQFGKDYLKMFEYVYNVGGYQEKLGLR